MVLVRRLTRYALGSLLGVLWAAPGIPTVVVLMPTAVTQAEEAGHADEVAADCSCGNSLRR